MGGRAPGFTLLEVLLVLALIAMVTALFVGGAATLVRERPATAEDVFWRAVTEARKFALLSNREVRLAYDEREKTFHASTEDGARSYPVPFPGELQIEFFSTQRSSSSILIGGQLVETNPLPAVIFYGDGTCTPFRAQLRTGGPARIITIDPWTCAPVLPAEGTS